jgi:hypothetical protein
VSPIRRALRMSCVIETAVAPSRRTQSTISPSMTAPMMGSSPVVGSSKKRMSGSAATARARPTRFCMPPESSAGERSPTDAASPTEASASAARSRAAARVIRRCARSLKQTFSHTGRRVEERAVLEQHPRAVEDRRAVPRGQPQDVPPVHLDRPPRPARLGRGRI